MLLDLIKVIAIGAFVLVLWWLISGAWTAPTSSSSEPPRPSASVPAPSTTAAAPGAAPAPATATDIAKLNDTIANSQLPLIGLINNLRSAIDPQSRVEAPRHQTHRPLTPRVDKKSTHARCGGDHCGVNLPVRGESRRQGPEMIALKVLG
jgi:hypothetical protein